MFGFVRKTFCILGCFVTVATVRTGSNEIIVPTTYEAGHFYAALSTTNGQRIKFLIDTGGAGFRGLYAVKKGIAQRLGVTVTKCKLDDYSFEAIGPIRFRAGAGIPSATSIRPCGADAMVIDGNSSLPNMDGMLGAGYLSQFIWTFDYPTQRLLIEPNEWHPEAHAECIPLSFAHDSNGKRVSDFPELTLKIDGAPVHLLLDTGATAFPTEAGLSASQIPTVKGEGVASYIVKSVFDEWHIHHPEWRVVERGDRLLPDTRLIEVPEIDLGKQRIGPVWFTERPDKNFGPEQMSGWMGQTVTGAAGANIFMHFRITIDYPHELLWVFSVPLPAN